MYVCLNSIVTAYSKLDGCNMVFQIIGSKETPLYKEKYSQSSLKNGGFVGNGAEIAINIESLLGSKLFDAQEGDVVSYVNAYGETEEYTILEIIDGAEESSRTRGIAPDVVIDASEIELIKNEVEKRNIWRLCHLTQTDKLLSILSSDEGILSQEAIVRKGLAVELNDTNRLDGHRSYVSCSVQRSNLLYHRAKRDVGTCKTWTMLSIDPSLCYDAKTRFCHVNAATMRGWYITRGYEGFLRMFSGYRDKSMLDSFTTDEQAEVMIFNSIPLKYITGISFPNVRVRDMVLAQMKDRGITTDARIRVESDMFY